MAGVAIAATLPDVRIMVMGVFPREPHCARAIDGRENVATCETATASHVGEVAGGPAGMASGRPAVAPWLCVTAFQRLCSEQRCGCSHERPADDIQADSLVRGHGHPGPLAMTEPCTAPCDGSERIDQLCPSSAGDAAQIAEVTSGVLPRILRYA